MVVDGAGRVSDFDGLELENAGIEFKKIKDIKVNKYLQSVSNKEV